MCAPDDDQRRALVLIGHGRVEDRHLTAIRPLGEAAFDDAAIPSGQHFVLDADVGEGAAHHDLMIAAPRPVGVELTRGDLPFHQVVSGGGLCRKRPGGADMVGGDHVAQKGHDARALDVVDRAGLGPHIFEIGRVLHVGGGERPVIDFAVGRLHAAPLLIALEDIGIFALKGVARHGCFHQFGDFRLTRPDVFEEHVLAVAVLAQRLGRQVDIQRAGQRIGHHQRRGGEVVGAHIRADPPFKVAVAGQDGSGDQIACRNRIADLWLQGAGIADAGGAAIAHKVEPDLVEILLQTCGLQIGADDLRAGREGGFHPWLAVEAKCCGLARHQPRADHHVWVGGVGAGGDRGDHDLAAFHLVVFALHRDLLAHGALEGLFHLPREGRFRLRQRDEVLRPLGAGNGGHNGAHVQLQRVCIDGRVVCSAPQTVGLGIGLHQCDAVLIPAGVAQVAQGLSVDGEKAAGRAVFGGHVGDGGTVCQR